MLRALNDNSTAGLAFSRRPGEMQLLRSPTLQSPDILHGGNSTRLPLEKRRLVVESCQSAEIPAARIGFAQRSISSGKNLARYSGVRCSGGMISSPSSSRRRRRTGFSSDWLTAALSLRTIESGVPLGKKNAFHTLDSTPARPCSPEVGISGTIATRWGASTA